MPFMSGEGGLPFWQAGPGDSDVSCQFWQPSFVMRRVPGADTMVRHAAHSLMY